MASGIVLVIVISTGSINQVPPFPSGAARSGPRLRATVSPEVSTKPPLPPSGPPRTLSRPATSVRWLA